jgi:3-methylfumaryl-CoA hydratase
MREVTDTDLQYLRTWIGRTEQVHDRVREAPVAALSATLDLDEPAPREGDELPILWHWLFCLSLHRSSELAADGHAHLGGFLPPVPLPRRLWAGGSVTVHAPPRIGDAVSRASRIADVAHKIGQTGALVFVTIEHNISAGGRLSVSERQTLVYREAPVANEPAAERRFARRDAAWTREVLPDEVLLFRYSALTFNGYRIHYDRTFATENQGYGGLVVHGPLLATLLADLVRRHLPDATVETFTFRAVRALIDGSPFLVCGSPSSDGRAVELWVQDLEGAVAMEATATFRGAS